MRWWRAGVALLHHLTPHDTSHTKKMIQTKLTKLKRVNVRPGYLYLISAVGTGKFKIGKTLRNVQERITNLQTGCPFRLRYVYHAYVANIDQCEMELHRRFEFQREIGEWFAFDPANVSECILLMRLLQVEPDENQSVPANWQFPDPRQPLTPRVRAVVERCKYNGLSQNATISAVWGLAKSGSDLRYQAARNHYQSISAGAENHANFSTTSNL